MRGREGEVESQKGEEHNRKHEEAWEQRNYGRTKESARKRWGR